MFTSFHRGPVAIGVACLAAALIGVGPSAAATGTATDTGSIYVIHGLPQVTGDVLIDGQTVETGLDWKGIAGPFEVDPGDHTVTLRPTTGSLTTDLTTTVPIAAGQSIDVVAHRATDPTAAPVITLYTNDLSPVAPDKSRLVVAHAAAVPPADIRVDGEVMFSNVANGEALTVLVPPGTYSVDIVPTGTDGPVVFGPVDLVVAAGDLTRVYALGSPDEGTMDAVVQTMPLSVEGADAPAMVETGSGGQVAAARELTTSTVSPMVPVGLVAFLLLGALAVGRARRTDGRPTSS